jgi:hypothetical protein
MQEEAAAKIGSALFGPRADGGKTPAP